MQCHYEVLEVPRDASLEDLKKSYRKLVLQWHPDKNLNNIQECRERFQLIQQAYDILSDPQERAWYDKHREDILKGGENYKDDSLNVFQYFRTSCFSGFKDDDKGFFTVYRGVFEKIAAEDTPFMDQEELLPSFGNSTSPYDEVVHLFYSHWQSYFTAKTYVWIEAYDIREAPNRRVVRLMEKENKKLRDQARKCRNEEIRELVSFVRKRDPRVQAHKIKLEEKKAENVRRAELLRKNAILERKKELSNYNECEWSNMSKLEADLKEIEAQLDNQFGKESYSESEDESGDGKVNDQDQQGDAEEVLDEEEFSLFCIACDKVFQSERAKLNHDNSKKHRENVALLREALEEEDEELLNQQLDDDTCEHSDEEELNKCENEVGEEVNECLQSTGSDSEVDKSKTRTKTSKKKKKALVIHDEESDGEELDFLKTVEENKNDGSEELNNSTAEKKGKKKRRRTKQEKSTGATTAPAPVEDPDSEPEIQKIMCGTCKSQFPSRNKLFSHLKSTNHSVYIEDKAKVSAPEKPAKSKGRKGRTKQRED